MGCSPFKLSSSSYDGSPNSCPAPDTKNPDPNNYKIVDHKKVGDFLIIQINYPNCTNFEGNKILVYKGVSLKNLLMQKLIDPHFSSNSKYYSPIARFVPNVEGWSMAVKLCSILKQS